MPKFNSNVERNTMDTLTVCVALLLVIISKMSFAIDIAPRERNAFIEEVNKVRREVQGPNMMEVVWNEDLATMASGYASGCNGYLNPTRNNQSTDREFNTVGEVHYIGRLEEGMSSSSLLLEAVVNWARPHSSGRNDSFTSQECTSCNGNTTMYQSEKYAQVTTSYEYSFISY